MSALKTIILLASLGLYSGCGSESSLELGPALKPGQYALTAPVCFSTGRAPAYPDLTKKISLLDFSFIEQHTLEIGNLEATRTLKSENCAVTITQPIHTNLGQDFSLKQTRNVLFTPESCQLDAVVNGISIKVGYGTATVVSNQTNPAPDLPFQLFPDEKDPDSKLMLSQDLDVLNLLWKSYGCSEKDRIKWTISSL